MAEMTFEISDRQKQDAHTVLESVNYLREVIVGSRKPNGTDEIFAYGSFLLFSWTSSCPRTLVVVKIVEYS